MLRGTLTVSLEFFEVTQADLFFFLEAEMLF